MTFSSSRRMCSSAKLSFKKGTRDVCVRACVCAYLRICKRGRDSIISSRALSLSLSLSPRWKNTRRRRGGGRLFLSALQLSDRQEKVLHQSFASRKIFILRSRQGNAETGVSCYLGKLFLSPINVLHDEKIKGEKNSRGSYRTRRGRRLP